MKKIGKTKVHNVFVIQWKWHLAYEFYKF